MSRHLPSDQEIRDRIEAVSDEKTRMALKFQYLIAGRISEVCGVYAPRGEDCFVTDFDGVLGVLFVVKTAKRKGLLRPVAVPLSLEYEPWADQVRDYFTQHRGDYPFRLHENWETSKTYAMKRATQALWGLEWPMIEYTRTFMDGEEKLNVKIPGRWKHATSHVLRKRRTLTLVLDHGFGPIDLAWYGGWTEHSQAANLPVAVKHYLHMDIQEAGEAMTILKTMAKRYFHKLLRKI